MDALTSGLIGSILVTLFCCMPFGLIGVVYAALAMGEAGRGDGTIAERHAKNARMWAWIGFGVGIAIMLLYFIFAVFAASAPMIP